MMQYETRAQTTGMSKKLSVCKKEVLAGQHPTIFALEGDQLVLHEVAGVTNHGKHDLLFISVGSSRSVNCRKDTRLLSPQGWITAEDISIGTELVSVRIGSERPRAGHRGPYVDLPDGVDALRSVRTVIEYKTSPIMWSGTRNDVMSVKMIGTDNYVTSTGLVIGAA